MFVVNRLEYLFLITITLINFQFDMLIWKGRGGAQKKIAIYANVNIYYLFYLFRWFYLEFYKKFDAEKNNSQIFQTRESNLLMKKNTFNKIISVQFLRQIKRN